MEAVSERPTCMDCSIPIEIVDDDELAAIETAFLQASSAQCSLPRSKSYAPSSIRAPPLQRSRSLAESANYWLTQCVNVKDRVHSLDSATRSKSLLGVHSIPSTCSCTEIILSSNAVKVDGQSNNSSCCKDIVSIKCCNSHEKATLVSSQSALDESSCKRDELFNVKNDVTRISQLERPQGQAHEAAISVEMPVVQDIEDLPSDKDVAKIQTEDVSLEPKPRCLSVTDFTAFVRIHVIPCFL